MASDSDINYEDVRDGIIDDTLDTLRDQRDDAQENDLSGSQDFNPQTFLHGKHMVLGPILFETTFLTAPDLTYGQQATINQADVAAGGMATNYEPFLVEPYTYQWVMDRGAVAGFFIGLYSMAGSPVGTKHTVSWRAKGKASVYKDERSEESWTEGYDHNEADYLVEDTSNTDEYVDD